MNLPIFKGHPAAAVSPTAEQFHQPAEVVVVIPALNEADNIEPLVRELESCLAGLAWEAIIVDDWSTDGTDRIALDLARSMPNLRLIRRYGRRGLSSAVVEGMLASAAPVCVVIDADLQHDPRIIPELFAAVADGKADVAIGTRYAAGGSTGEWSGGRLRISSLATRLVGILPLPRVSDPMSGFFAIRRAALLDALPRLSSTGFKILLDLLVSSPRQLAVAEVPYRFRKRHSGESKLDSAVALQFGMLLLDKLVGRWVSPRFILFAAVGSFGVLLHLMFLRLFLGMGALFPPAQAGAVVLTIAANFLLNNQLTYRDRRLKGVGLAKGLAGFYAVCGLGAIANVGVGSLVFANRNIWWVAGIAGGIVGALWNYMASSALVWKRN